MQFYTSTKLFEMPTKELMKICQRLRGDAPVVGMHGLFSTLDGVTETKQRLRLINEIFNKQVENLPNFDSIIEDKPVPYIGWFWRNTDFFGSLDNVYGGVSIGRLPDSDANIIGIMENNKWDYSERKMSEDERNQFVEYLDNFFKFQDIKALIELGAWMQTLDNVGVWCEADCQGCSICEPQ